MPRLSDRESSEKDEMGVHLITLLYLLFSLHCTLHLPVSSASGKSSGVCKSPGGRFTPFLNEGKPPKKASKGPRDLTFCRVFRKQTCCDVSQTLSAFLSIRRLASNGEASEECLLLWELLECSICDPNVGVQPGPPAICASLCDKAYHACSNAYFSMDSKTQVLAPCGVNDFVCGRASEWISNGTELCRAAGFSVISDDVEDALCYGGKATKDSIADSWKTSQSGYSQKSEPSGVLEDFKQWMELMPITERVSWAIGGLVLTAGLIFTSRRKNRSRRQKQAALQRTARKLGTRMTSGSPMTQANRLGYSR